VISFNKAGSIHRTDLKGYSVYSDQFKKNEIIVSISIDPTSTKQFPYERKTLKETLEKWQKIK
jgi:hypothetical protein